MRSARSAADAVLLSRAARGNRSAFNELFRRHAHPAWRVGMAVGGSAEVAQHAVIEAFTSVFRHLESGTATLAKPFRELLVRETVAAAVADAGSGIARTASDEKNDPNAVISAYRSLPQQWRTVLWLSAVEGGSAQQIGSLLGLPADAAARLASRARSGLRRRFIRAGASPDDPLLTDLGSALRPLVTPMPAEVNGSAAAWWLTWRGTSSARRHGLAGVAPFGPWAEKALAGATATVLTAGIASAIVLGGREATRRSPYLAERAGSGELAGGSTTAVAPPGGAGSSVAPWAQDQHRATLLGAGEATAPDPAPAPAAAATVPRTGQQKPSSGAPAKPLPGGSPPPAATPPATGVSVGANPGGVPVGVAVGERPGARVGPVSVGNPPPPSSSPITVAILTGGALPPIVVTLP